MPAPATNDEFLDLVRKSGVLDEKKLDAYLEKIRSSGTLPGAPGKLAGFLVRDGVLTQFQAEQFMLGKWRGFTIGKYKVLEKLGTGGMGAVYLCEHKLMRRRVAVKVLPKAKADDPACLERFYREARAVAALDHPNIVRAYDIDQDDKLHFLVMEYVDGSSLQDIIKKAGAMDVLRAAHYIRQAALGLQHAHESAGLVHRDIKPGNILVDRNGIVKILDMGLARFFHDEEDVLTKKYDENVLGTADYLAPEQALDSHGADIRADIYSLGATLYFCLSGRTPFNEGTVAQKLIWHQTRQPKPIRSLRPEVPEGLAAIVERMMAKDKAQRYPAPLEVVHALDPFTQTPIPPPPDAEMPRLSPAASGVNTSDALPAAPGSSAQGMPSPTPRRWQLSGSPTPAQPSPPSPPPGKKGPPSNPPPRAQANAPATPASPAPSAGGAAVKVAAAPIAGVQPPRNGLMVPSPAANTTAEQEEGAPWEALAPTSDPPTVRSSTARSTVPPASRTSARKAPPDHRRRLILLLGIVGAIVLLAGLTLAVTVAFVLRSSPPGDTSTTTTTPERQTLYVSRTDKGPNTCRTVLDAWRKARAGDTIVLLDETIDEGPLFLDDKQGKLKHITLEGSPDLGKPVQWTCPTNVPAGATSLLTLNHVEGFRLARLKLNGAGRLETGLLLSGRCPGVTVEDVQVAGFKNQGILVMNCAGEPERRLVLDRLEVTGTDPQKDTAVTFGIRPTLQPTMNQHIQFRECRFKGNFKQPVARVTIGSDNKPRPATDGVLDGTVVWQDAGANPIPLLDKFPAK